MNEMLKRRLIGLLLILLLLFIISLILPKPGELPPSDEKIQRITLDLQASAIQPTTTLPPIATPLPPALEAAKPAEPQSQKTMVDTEPDIEVPPLPEAVSAVTVKAAEPIVSAKARPKVPTKPVVTAQQNIQTPGKSVASAQKWYVQLGAFSDVDNARQLLQKFKTQKYSGILSPADTSKGTRYRVRIGPYVSRDQAADAQKRMIKAGVTGTTVIEG